MPPCRLMKHRGLCSDTWEFMLLITDDEQWQTEANEQRWITARREEQQHSDGAHSHDAATAAVFEPAAAPFVFFKLFSGEPNEKSAFLPRDQSARHSAVPEATAS